MWSFSFCVSNCPRQTYISASSYDNTFLPSIWDWSFQTEVHSILEVRHVLILLKYLSYLLTFINQDSPKIWFLLTSLLRPPVSRKCVGDLVKASSSHRSGSIPDICHFFTLTHFESWKFYIRKVRKFTTNGAQSSNFCFFLEFFTLSQKFYTHSVTGVPDKYQVCTLLG